ncbi:DNA cytosine methyltransferase [Escherichia coli]|uniref:DNA cytosine methyltransferase n=1 Tax=Escherichia coli TaxID=562 RepID=UPI0020340DCC|nr:DNA cytosine methyltransferase [Escherichia coli]
MIQEIHFLCIINLLNEIKPNGFIFENVAGLLNMEKGKVFERVKEEFSSTMKTMNGWILNSEHYAIPQRRKKGYIGWFKRPFIFN